MHQHWLLWGGLALAGAGGLAALAHIRWLQSQTLKKCVLLSVGVHAVLAIVACFIGGARPASWGEADDGRMTMLVVPVAESADDPVADEAAALTDVVTADEAVTAAADASDAFEPPPADLVPLLPVLASADDVSAFDDAAKATSPPAPAANAVEADPRPSSSTVPPCYAARFGDKRAAAAAARGGSLQTERAVQAALAWLAVAQAADGRWSVVEHGGGVERAVQGHDRRGAGAKSDHGVTGLALLAFLGAGQTHRDGPYADVVARGLRFLTERQRADGSLAGDAEFFAALYCHGMATLALGEACALTQDAALRPAVERAVRHTLAMQHSATGGWRYAAGDRGDTSQLGWQVMVLETARQVGITAGIEPAEARARTFLQSVSSGRAGGLAAYRPGERPSMAMTAEALLCRLFLGLPAEHAAVQEALASLAATPPDAAHPNAYAWYYATLASFHAGGPQWEAWNARLLAALLPLQRQGPGAVAGSWDPDPVWGGHGGRVYATALSAMTLEVYYRHAPAHEQQDAAGEHRQFASQTPGIRLQE
jgi:hypothetical protein